MRASDDFAIRLEPALRTAPGTSAAAHGADPGGADPGGAGRAPSDQDGRGHDGRAALVALAVEVRDAARPLAGVVPRQEFRTALAQRLAEQARELEPRRII